MAEGEAGRGRRIRARADAGPGLVPAEDRLTRLERELAELRAELGSLREALGEDEILLAAEADGDDPPPAGDRRDQLGPEAAALLQQCPAAGAERDLEAVALLAGEVEGRGVRASG